MSAQIALGAARTAAAVARTQSTAANVEAARSAIAAARAAAGIEPRYDAAHGYNPYRGAGGKFAPGPRKERPKTGRDRAALAAAAVEKHGARVEVLGKRLAVHKASHAAAIGEAKLALEGARGKAEIARAKPTQRNVKAAQVATNKATRAAANVSKLEAIIGKHTAAHAAAVAKHEAAKQKHAELQAGARGVRSARKATPASAPSKEPTVTAKTAPAGRILTNEQQETARKEFTAKLTPAEKAAAERYSKAMYRQVNGGLRDGTISPEGIRSAAKNREPLAEFDMHEANGMGRDREQVERAVAHLDSLMHKAAIAEPIVTYRGSHTHDALENLQPGQTFTDKGFVSTSSARDRIMGADYLFVITNPAGTKLAPIPSGSPSEREMLLGRGTSFRVDRREEGTRLKYGEPIRQLVYHVTVVGQEEH